MLGSIFSEIARDSWTNTPDNAMVFVNDSNGNPVTITYYQGTTAVFVKTFTYDSNGNTTRIECSTPTPQN